MHSPIHSRLVVITLVVLALVACACTGPARHAHAQEAGVEAAPAVLPADAQKTIEALHAKYLNDQGGAVADYIPELAKVDSKLFGIVIATVDGKLIEIGDTEVPFTIQSICKPFAYGLALADHSREELVKKIGVEPTGLPFNSILAAEVRAVKTQNPLVNAGAIATSSLIKGKDSAERFARLMACYETFAGEKLTIDDPVFKSEMATNAKNMSLAYLLKNSGLLYADVDDTVMRYTKACSVSINCHQLALMGATLANGGVNPITKKRALSQQHVTDVLSVMCMAGMYDYSGQWFFRVGLPAKSGVGGGIVAVVPGKFAIATFAPPLDKAGNSVRGVKVIQDLSAQWKLHAFRVK